MKTDELFFFFAMILIGYFSAKYCLLPAQAADVLPALLLNICYPAIVLDTFLSVDTDTLLHSGLPIAAATFFVTLLLFPASLLLFRNQPPDRKPLLCFICAVGNVTYVAIPLMSVFIGTRGLLAAVVHGTAQDLLIWSMYHQLFLGSNVKGRGELIKKMAASPCLIAVLLGILLAVLRIPLPSALTGALGRIGSVTSPAALILLGFLIHSYGPGAWIRDRAAILYAFFKVLLFPCVLFLLLRPFLTLQDALLTAILFASPAPVISIIWSREYGGDTGLAVNCVMSSTLLFLVCMSGALAYFSCQGIL